MTVAGTPTAEVEIDEAMLRGLLREQMPALADASIALLDTGWDNVLFRVGEDRIARMPRREVAVPLLASEQRWLAVLAPRLPIPVPAPIAIGRPGNGYPWPWSLVPFLPGQTANLSEPASSQAEAFAKFLRALHRPAPDDAPHNPHRGVVLRKRAEDVEARLARLREKTDSISTAVDDTWRVALETPTTDSRDWVHGDLHAQNILVDRGRFSGILDWGDMTAGDAATDLAATWMLFEEPRARRRVLDAYGASRELRARTRGWAVFFGSILLDAGLVDDPQHAAVGDATLRRLGEDD